eukprot:1907692-Pyramimonas_sp.AAC.1
MMWRNRSSEEGGEWRTREDRPPNDPRATGTATESPPTLTPTCRPKRELMEDDGRPPLCLILRASEFRDKRKMRKVGRKRSRKGRGVKMRRRRRRRRRTRERGGEGKGEEEEEEEEDTCR